MIRIRSDGITYTALKCDTAPTWDVTSTVGSSWMITSNSPSIRTDPAVHLPAVTHLSTGLGLLSSIRPSATTRAIMQVGMVSARARCYTHILGKIAGVR